MSDQNEITALKDRIAEREARVNKQSLPFMRMAELEIDPAQLKGYLAAVREEIKTSVQAEPGVPAIHAKT